MKVIDLLNKIANGEEVPKKIKFENKVYVLDHEGLDFYALEEGYGLLLEKINDTNLLNVEVEIIEEKPKFETIGIWHEDIIKGLRNGEEISNWQIKNYISVLMATQNQIIDIVNYLLNKEENEQR